MHLMAKYEINDNIKYKFTLQIKDQISNSQ